MISTHVLDTALGRPASGIGVRLERRGDDGWEALGEATTDGDGRVRELPGGAAVQPGAHRLTFDTGAYFGDRPAFYPEVTVTFTIERDEHHHVPLLLSPYGYSTYRGS